LPPAIHDPGNRHPEPTMQSTGVLVRLGAPDGRSLRVRLIDASNGNIDALSDISPIRALIAQGCDLEADVLPVVARLIPELPRPLKNWGAPWLVRDYPCRPRAAAWRWDFLGADPVDIRNSRTEDNQRLAGAEFSTPTPDLSLESGNTVDAPPPLQRTPVIAWDEFVAAPCGSYRMEHGAARAQAGRAGVSRTGRGAEGTRI
jgi:hypothetical protein